MNILFWVLQALLALHTIIGAIWKFINPEQTVPSLKAIPHAAWLGLGVLELMIALGLIVPALSRSLGVLAPIAAVCIAAEMLLFCGVAAASGNPNSGQMIYWLVVAAICAFIAYGRWVMSPIAVG